jgi:hypothetical protein
MKSLWKDRALSPQQVVATIKSHDRVYLHGAAAAPQALESALCARPDLEAVEL